MRCDVVGARKRTWRKFDWYGMVLLLPPYQICGTIHTIFGFAQGRHLRVT